MKLFLMVWAAGWLLVAGGCAWGSGPNPDQRVACLLVVNEVEAGAPGSYVINTSIYDEAGGELLATPKLIVNAGQRGSVVLAGEEKSDGDNRFQSVAFGAVPCCVGTGIRTMVAVTPGATPETVQVRLLVVWQAAQGDMLRLFALDVPAVEVPLGQSVLLLQRADGCVVIPVDPDSPESVAEARLWSPRFATWQ